MKACTNSRIERQTLKLTLFLLLLATYSPRAWGQRGAIAAPRNLAEMVDEAGIIVRGQIVSAKVEPHPDFPALWTVVVTLRVDESLKGQPGGKYTFRQFIWDPRDREDAAGYRTGNNLLLLLVSPSTRGLSGPVALEQGRFQITTDSAGNLYAANGRNNLGLLNGVAARATAKGVRLTPRASALVSTPPQGPLAISDLRDIIHQLVGAN
jgi:hypothetical protein